METPWANPQPHKNAFQELLKCTPPPFQQTPLNKKGKDHVWIEELGRGICNMYYQISICQKVLHIWYNVCQMFAISF